MFDLKSNARILLALTATVIASAPICHADDSPVSVRVKYSDLNTDTVQGAHRLYTRIEAAANSACGTSNTDAEVIMSGPGPCVRNAIARAVRDVKSPALAQVYIEKNGARSAQEFGITAEMRTASKN
jgi:UrcA family protein